MALEDVEGGAGDEVAVGIQADFILTLALVGYATVERAGFGGGIVGSDVKFEVNGEGEANDIEAGADVGGGAGNFDDAGHGEERMGCAKSATSVGSLDESFGGSRDGVNPLTQPYAKTKAQGSRVYRVRTGVR